MGPFNEKEFNFALKAVGWTIFIGCGITSLIQIIAESSNW